eukprot:GHRQ01025216.1.p1 GENE.GHRQ01025216.1~~GHRQ01025216.1.p1  ORF type:complete len:133 (+),score=13.58 GHRQ01025216.1:110-508(+)
MAEQRGKKGAALQHWEPIAGLHRRSQRARRPQPSAAACSSDWLVTSWLLLLCLLPVSHGAHVQVSKSMKDHLKQFVGSVPAGRDYLGEMTEAQRTAWSHDLGYSINETLQALSEARVPITVDVKLVGFAGDG